MFSVTNGGYTATAEVWVESLIVAAAGRALANPLLVGRRVGLPVTTRGALCAGIAMKPKLPSSSTPRTKALSRGIVESLTKG
eukprot:CAMPEP_0172630502 /NCGR_PEP_ID=MMETSP1068-20121228/174027_1 /TAXON_ID=35684 /ORGANISM="Pseudopedinella elastica, Strain CCMP716" /LENGTH=81 /DNA_ID=CAMNT_0013441363 /DNA_START=95 /DNA_END=340 /DNA_ORIENTATION=-